MRTQSPWITLLSAALVLVMALWFFSTAYAPSDATPLHRVEGSIGSVATTWVYHSQKGGGWNAPVVSIATGDAGSIHFTAHSKDESPAVLALASLMPGTPLRAQVDASGEIWELTANEHEVVPLSDTLDRHHQLAHRRNLVCSLMLLLGVGLGVSGFKRLQARSTR